MQSKSKVRLSISALYTLGGVLFGLLFPVLATILGARTLGLRLSVDVLRQLHRQPLMQIIDTAPLFFGIFAYMVGYWYQRYIEQIEKLEDLVGLRSKDIIRQKLFYEALVDNSPIAIATLDQYHKIISINPAFQALFGYHQEEITGQDLDELISNPERPHEAYAITEKVWQGDAIHEFGKRRRKDGSMVDVEIFGEQIIVNGNRIGVLGLYRDITVEKLAQEALSTSEERFRRMFSDSPVALRMEDCSDVKFWLDANITQPGLNLREYMQEHPEIFEMLTSLARIIDLNDASLYMFGARGMKDLQEHLHSILGSESRNDAIGVLDAMLDGQTTLERELVYRRLDGQLIYAITKLSIIPGYEQSWGRVLFSSMDITERKLAEERLTYISLHDIMTSVYNRAFFEEEMSRLSKSRLHPISILVMDMDNLKAINDQLGHQAGDDALQTIAEIVKQSFRGEDIIARIGGDEFAVLLTGADAETATQAKARILAGIAAHNQNSGRAMPLSLSIGCATSAPGDDLTHIFKTADTAMYVEKKARKQSS